MKRLKSLKRNESGATLILVLCMLVLGSFMMVPLLNMAASSVNYHETVERNTVETYSAEAGVEYAIAELGNDTSSYKTEPLDYNFAINNKTVDVTSEYMGDDVFKITSVATTEEGQSTQIESYVYAGSSGGASSFDNAITALDGDAWLTGNVDIASFPDWGEADIYAHGNVRITGNVDVDGDVTATGTITTTGNINITGDETEYGELIVYETVDPTPYLNEADSGMTFIGDLNISGNGSYYLGPAHITGDLKVTGNRTLVLTGTVYVDGEVKMTGNSNIVGPGTVVCVGDIQLTGNTKLDPENIPVLYSTNGNIMVTGNSWSSVVLYAPNGEVRLTGNSKVYGSIVGQSVRNTGNNAVEYPVDLRDREDLPDDTTGGGVTVMTWQID